jgi:DNA polymerase-3 subunit alpha
MVYQEQVMQISNRLAGYSLGEADLLRRAMGKKKLEEMAKQRARFLEGAKANGHPLRRVEKIFDLMEKFAGYGFNKSHSAAYAYLAFITAYLKTHYPLEFMAALLTSQTGNTAQVVKYINECREIQIRVLAPDVNSSELDFTPVEEGPEVGIRFGLGAIKNVGASAVESIVKTRTESGRFGSLYDFCERVDLGAVNRRMIESLIKAGAMDSLEGTRAQLSAVIDGAMESGARAWKDRASGQSGLFASLMEEHPAAEHPLPAVPEWTGQQQLVSEKEMLGFYITGHPLDQYMDKVKELAKHTTGQLEGLSKNTEVALCGILTGVQRKRSKEGKLWAAMQIEDLEGAVEGMVFSTQYERLLPSLTEDQAVLVRGLVLPEENAPPKISIQDIVPLEVARISLPSLISIRVPMNGAAESDRAAALRQLFEQKPGETEVRLRLEKPRDFSVILDVTAKVRPDKEFCAEVARICGAEAMEVLAG